MDIHKNARLTPHGRERLAKMIVSGQTPQAASEAAGVCPRTGRKWRDRFEQEGLAGLQDRSSRPKRLRKPTPPEVIERIASLRRQRMPGKEIATTVGVSPATVSRVLKRLGLSKLSALEPAEPPRRYEREQPGEMIHSTSKARQVQSDRPPHHRRPHRSEQRPRRRLGVLSRLHRRRLARGLQQDHEDRARALCRDLPQGRRRLLQSLGITVLRVMTDNGSCYRSKPSPGLAGASSSSTSGQSPTPRAPTARPSASSRHRYENGPMPVPI